MTRKVPKAPKGQAAFGAWLAKLRREAGVNQATVAAAAGLSERQVKRWEKDGNGTFLSFMLYLESVGVRLDPAPIESEADELFRRLEVAVERIEHALAGQQVPPDVPRSAEAGP